MKFNKILKISISRTKQNKKRNTILLLPLIIVLTTMFLINLISYSIYSYIENIQDNLDLRTINGLEYKPNTYSEKVEKIYEIEHVEMVIGNGEERIYADQICKQFINEKSNGNIALKSVNENVCPEVIEGRKIETNDKYVVIIPDKIYLGKDKNDLKTLIEDDYIDGRQFLGKKINMYFSNNNINFEREFEVIGIYDSVRYNENGVLYSPIQIIKRINEDVGYIHYNYQLTVIVDKFENVDKVKNEIYNKKIIEKSPIQIELENVTEKTNTQLEGNISNKLNISLDTINIIRKLIIFLWIMLFFIIFVIIIVTNINKNYIQLYEIGIMRVQGYTKKDIQKIMIIENILVCIISFIISIFLFTLIKMTMNCIFINIIDIETMGITANKVKQEIYYILQIPQKLNILHVVFTFLLIISILIVNTYIINKRVLKRPIKDILTK